MPALSAASPDAVLPKAVVSAGPPEIFISLGNIACFFLDSRGKGEKRISLTDTSKMIRYKTEELKISQAMEWTSWPYSSSGKICEEKQSGPDGVKF